MQSMNVVNNKSTGLYGSIEHEPTKVSGNKPLRAIGWIALLVLMLVLGYALGRMASPSQGSDLLTVHQYAIHSAQDGAAIDSDIDAGDASVELCFDPSSWVARDGIGLTGTLSINDLSFSQNEDDRGSLTIDLSEVNDCLECMVDCINMHGEDTVEYCMGYDCYNSCPGTNMCPSPTQAPISTTPEPTQAPISTPWPGKTSTPWPSKPLGE